MVKRIILATFFLAISPVLFPNTSGNITGIWEGTLEVQGTELPVVFKIKEKSPGNFTATLDSPNQGAFNIPVDEVKMKGSSVTLTIKSINGTYTGELNAKNNKITGNWTQSGLTLPLNLEKVEKESKRKRPQEPKKPYPYLEEEVKFRGENAIELAGTLTIPKSKGSHPAVILISGSGPQDRDETVFGHKPFLVLADYLTRKGIAVLRYDDRGVGQSTGSFEKATIEDFCSDALSAVEYLKSRKEIDSENIGLIGHSEGGIIAPIASVENNDISFIVLMAGPTLPVEDILELQNKLLLKAQGKNKKEIEKILETNKYIYSIAKEEEDLNKAKEQIKNIFEKIKKEYGEEVIPESMIKEQISKVLSPWFRSLLSFDPAQVLKKLKCPVLAIYGEKDTQVPPKENIERLREIINESANKNFKIKEFSGLNHLFQPSKTGLPTEYAKIEKTISPVVLETIGKWIKEQTD